MSNFEVLESFIQLRRMVALLRSSEIKDLNFGHNQIGVLYRLSLSNATMSELAENALSDKASMTRTVAVLEKEGFVKRTSDPNDGRIVNIQLTPKGKVQAKRAQKIRNSIGRKIEIGLTPEERKKFVLLVQKIIKGIAR